KRNAKITANCAQLAPLDALGRGAGGAHGINATRSGRYSRLPVVTTSMPAWLEGRYGERLMKIAPIFAAAFWLCSTPALPVLADGGGSDDRTPVPTCGRGEVWDSRNRRCVKAENGILPDKALAANAFALAKDGRYPEALAVLDLLQDPNTAEALNYRGFATRKLGHLDEGIGYYLKSVALDPQYAQVREYLGEG